MKKRTNWILYIVTIILMMAAMVIAPPIDISQARGRTETAVLAGAAGLGIGACAMFHHQRQRPKTTVIVTGHQHGPGCGHTYYDGLWYPSQRCIFYSDRTVVQCE